MQPFTGCTLPPEPEQRHWGVSTADGVLGITYGQNEHHPQYAALHLDSGYFRLLNEPVAGWGTSVIVLPSFWEQGNYRQGAPLAVEWTTDHTELLVTFVSEIYGLRATGNIRLAPPRHGRISAVVSVSLEGNAMFDFRPGEAFKPVALSSMRVSESDWDAREAYIEFQSYDIPKQGWISGTANTGRVFGLIGGTSDWKGRAPTVEIALDRTMHIGGWVTQSQDPNDDNVGIWAATERPIRSWNYRVTAKS